MKVQKKTYIFIFFFLHFLLYSFLPFQLFICVKGLKQYLMSKLTKKMTKMNMV